MTTKQENLLECDYLVVGAGAAPLAFIDTLLTELPESKIILIDKKEAPGGHWVDAYGFVRLHQPSLVYGLASKQLEGNWGSLMFKKFMLPWKHRANKQEMLTYFSDFVNEKVASQQVEFYPNSVFNFEKSENDPSCLDTDEHRFHYFSSVDGSVSYKVKVNVKLIDGTHGRCIIPHDSPFQFPVDEEVRVMTPNQLYDTFEEKRKKISSPIKNKYVVLGAGKTGMDCIVYLQRTMKVDPSDIAWVIANDVWMMNAESTARPGDWPHYLAKFSNDEHKAALALEKKGLFVRLDKKITPTRFRFPMIPSDELKLLRKVKTIIRRGRATAIRKTRNSGVEIEFGSDYSPWQAFAPIENCVFVHATSPGPFNDNDRDIPIFNNPKKMTLKLIFAPPVSFSMSVLAKIEATRRKGTLDVDFMRRLAVALGEEKSKTNEFDENDLLKVLIKSVGYFTAYQSLMTQAIIFAILDRDPMVAIKWMKQNRLSFLSIPGVKSEACNDVRMLCARGKTLGLQEGDIKMLEDVGEKIKPLKGL